MNVTVVGLWHLGCVTAACCARHFIVVGLDFDQENVAALNQGRAPLLEPGLEDRLAEGLKAGRLRFTTDPAEACRAAEVLWLTYDTPVDDQDVSDVPYVLIRLRRCLPHLPPGALVLISSQLPAGTCAQLEKEFPQFHFACSPENLRLGRALEAFEKAERVVVGMRNEAVKPLLTELLSPFTLKILWMGTESAEMVKHALNAFLATSVTFINEIARICEQVGADAREVSAGLKSDVRIGPKAYLGPGGPFAGGTLARDIVSLTALGETYGETLTLVPAIKQSNDQHRQWTCQRLNTLLGGLTGRVIGILGLTYTPNTSTLRRSAVVELCQQLTAAGAVVRAYDPAVKTLPAELSAITLCSLEDAVKNAEATVVCTEWPEFRRAPWSELTATMQRKLIVDANGFLTKELNDMAGVEHVWVGRPHLPKPI
ncbi:MAG: nucleotide sugar dehydrogenase [Verrucomicrobiota bacterium]